MITTIILFAKVFGLLILIFVGVIGLFVYPTNMLYNNEKFESKGETNKLFIGSGIFLAIITILLYFFYHLGTGYMCSISSYFDCTNGGFSIGIYILLLIHLILILVFNLAFINRLKEIIKDKKLDIYLFIFASISIFLVLLNFSVYETIFSNISLVFLFVRIIMYVVALAPIYSYLVINYLLLPKEKRKRKKKANKKKQVIQE